MCMFGGVENEIKISFVYDGNDGSHSNWVCWK